MSIGFPSRRDLLRACIGALLVDAASGATPASNGSMAIARIEETLGGRLGVFALNTGNGRFLRHRADERFAMCSTFKWVLAAAILAAVDRREVSLDARVAYGAADILEYAPITARHVAEGFLPVRTLCRAVITVSDNTAANLLLRKLGGPTTLTGFIRSCDDSMTRLDRYEPDLNENAAGDVRDTTTPRAMVALMQKILCGDVLADASRELLFGWMEDCETGRNRLRAGVPDGWKVGDKTGSGRRGAASDVAIVFPPGGAPVLIAAYTSDVAADASAVAAGQAAVGGLAVRELA
ncbi:MAG: class A beta-lactamase [Gammaproteobacteria bacterium]